MSHNQISQPFSGLTTETYVTCKREQLYGEFGEQRAGGDASLPPPLAHKKGGALLKNNLKSITRKYRQLVTLTSEFQASGT